ncbi:hypothetical protein SEVIR_9G165801v4 [Setaria viridis]
MMARASPSFSELGQGRPHSAAALEQPAAASPSPSKAYALATWMEPECFIQWYADVLRINGGSRFVQQERRVAWRRTRQQRWRCGGTWGGPRRGRRISVSPAASWSTAREDREKPRSE